VTAGGGHHDNAKWKPKKCVVCTTEFIPRTGINKFCSTPCRGKWKYITGAGSTAKQYEKINGNWDRYFSRLLRAGGMKRVHLTVADLKRAYEKQQGRCALTGELLTCTLQVGVRSLTNASVDRVQAGGDYLASNIQLVCIAVNKWRGDMEVPEFVKWCKRVSDHSDEV